MELVKYTVDGAVATITLDRPPVNALNNELIAEIHAAADEAADPSVRAVVITGSPHFAAGADITGFQKTFEAGGKERQASGLVEAGLALERLAKPTIAAVTGYALGGGLELALTADFRYLAEGAKVGQPEIKLGIIPGAGGTQRLARVVGAQRCKELCMSGRHVTAEEALAIGLADKVCPDDEVLQTALEDAAVLAAGPTVALAAVKAAVNGGFGAPIEEGLAIEAAQFAKAFASDDARTGVAAFINKETPEFKGR